MNLTRRQLVRRTARGGGALGLGFSLGACREGFPQHTASPDYRPDAYLSIGEDDAVIMQLPKAEMGQGVMTGLATVLAEELEIEPGRIRCEMAPVAPEFRDPEYRLQLTGGSSSIRVLYQRLREVGATAREVLLAAAAQQSGIPLDQLFARDGRVASRDGTYGVRFGSLVDVARELPLPERVALKSPGNFRYIGHYDDRLDAAGKADGSARFGIDVQPENCATAVVVRSPRFGGKLIDFDASAAIDLPGLVDIFPIAQGVAVVAEGYWQARRAADQVQASFLPPESGLLNGDDLEAAMQRALDGDDFVSLRDDAPVADRDGGRWLEADYRLPFLAHATMEPQNATAYVRDGRCDLWLGTQSPDIARAAAARVLGLPAAAVTVHNQYLGGGFGRRLMPDVALEVAAIAAHLERPVKLVWSREDDTRHDYYRPAMAGRLRARINADGSISDWWHRLAGPSIYQQLLPDLGDVMLPSWVPGAVTGFIGDRIGRRDSSAAEGAAQLPYRFDGVQVAFHNLPSPLPLGMWRSVGHSHTAFVVESFVDELAHAVGEDPLAFRRRHLPEHSRQRRVLDAAAGAAGWGEQPSGRYRGIAVHESFDTAVAQVVEISLQKGRPRLERVWCAVDCGQVINPGIARDQIEGGLVFGLTAALYGEITLRDGAVVQGNFHDYPMLRHHEMPEVEVILLASDAAPSGVGEPGTPPAAPALANAIFAATGQRLRRLPLRLAPIEEPA